MAENKTKPTSASVDAYIDAISNAQRKRDCKVILELMQDITNTKPVMWGTSIVGFGSYHYKYESGREGDMCVIGFSNRAANITLYLANGFDRYEELIAQLGKCKTSKACLYIKKLADIDMSVLRKLVQKSVEHMNANYETTY